MKKNLISLALALCLLFCLVPVHARATEVVDSGTCGENLTWTLDKDGTLTISGAGPMDDYSPETLYFAQWDQYLGMGIIKKLVIDQGVTSIGNYAFRSISDISTITIPDTITSIGNHAFEYCTALTEITIPDSVISIGNYAFLYCESISTISIGSGVTAIGDSAFRTCTNLSNIHVNEYNQHYANDSYGVLFNKDLTECIRAPYALEGEYLTPNTMEIVKEYAFEGCESLSSVTMQENVKVIGKNAFANCAGLISVVMPETVSVMGELAFYGCTNLTNISLGNEITSIPRCTFELCTELTSITIPSSVTYIGEFAFDRCNSLSEVRFEGDVPSMDASAFTEVNADAFYPAQNPTWTPDVMKDYGGTITWVAYDPNGELPSEPSDPIEPEPMENPFVDVGESDYFYEPVLWAVAGNITGGIGNNRFGPNQSCTRGQIVTFLWAANGRPEPTSTENPFSDVKSSDFYYTAVLWAVENGITGGVGNGRFGPNQTCTRGQVATFLWAAKGRPAPVSGSNPFSDVKSSDYYYTAVLWAVENGITGGVGNGKFGPSQICTRGQIVTFLHKAYA